MHISRSYVVRIYPHMGRFFKLSVKTESLRIENGGDLSFKLAEAESFVLPFHLHTKRQGVRRRETESANHRQETCTIPREFLESRPLG